MHALCCPVLQALSERQAIDDFLAAGQALLNLRASSVEEIGKAGQEARALVTRLAEVPQVRFNSNALRLLSGNKAAPSKSFGNVAGSLMSVMSICWDLSIIGSHENDTPL